MAIISFTFLFFIYIWQKREENSAYKKLASQNIMLIQINYQQKYHSTKNTVIIKKQNKKKYC